MKKDNRGLSLVELVIVIAIMTVLTGVISMGIGIAVSKPADECASKLKAALQNARVTSMGKLDTTISVYTKDEKIYLMQKVVSESGTNSTETLIGAKGVEVKYKISGESSYRDLGDSSHPLVLSFNRSSGAFKDLSAMGFATKTYCVEIQVSKGNKTKLLKLSSLTGKIQME